MAKNNKHQFGFSLIESLVALALLSIALLSIQIAILKSSKIARNINEQIQVEIEANNAVENFWSKGVTGINNNLSEVLKGSPDFQTLTCTRKNLGKYKGKSHIKVSRVLYPKKHKARSYEK